MKRIDLGFALLVSAGAFQGATALSGVADETNLYMGSKTPYVPHQDASTYEKAPANCKPIYLNLLSRHGSRMIGGRDDIQDLLKDLEGAKTQSSLSRDGENVYKWLKELNEKPEFGLLTQLGEKEQFGLGQRAFANYPELFENKRVTLGSTFKKRTVQSRDAFKKGLKAHATHAIYFEEREGKRCEDFQLRYFDSCSRYQDSYKKENKKRKNKYAAKFLEEDSKMSHVKDSVSKLFTQADIFKSPNAHILRMGEDLYSLCQHDHDVDPATAEDRFCTVVDKQERHLYEFAKDDLGSFYKLGPVQKNKHAEDKDLNFKMACLPLQNFLDEIDSAVKGTNPTSAHLRFAHLETVLPFALLVGLFPQEEDLKAEPSEQWQSAKIGGMASNMQWVAYQCTEGSKTNYKVKMYYDEQEFHFPIESCQDSYFCDWDAVKEFYKQRFEELGLGTCSMEEWNKMCSNGSDNGRASCENSDLERD